MQKFFKSWMTIIYYYKSEKEWNYDIMKLGYQKAKKKVIEVSFLIFFK
jgi:hypothetical protein